MPVPAQIALLLALTARLFDAVALEKMTGAEQAVHEAAAKIPPEICARFETADKLTDEDRAAVIARLSGERDGLAAERQRQLERDLTTKVVALLEPVSRPIHDRPEARHRA